MLKYFSLQTDSMKGIRKTKFLISLLWLAIVKATIHLDIEGLHENQISVRCDYNLTVPLNELDCNLSNYSKHSTDSRLRYFFKLQDTQQVPQKIQCSKLFHNSIVQENRTFSRIMIPASNLVHSLYEMKCTLIARDYTFYILPTVVINMAQYRPRTTVKLNTTPGFLTNHKVKQTGDKSGVSRILSGLVVLFLPVFVLMLKL